MFYNTKIIIAHLKPLFFLTIPLVILLNINFLYFHVLIEAYTVAISVTIFIIAFNTRKYYQNSFYALIGISFLSVGFIDFIHSLTYKGMTIYSLMSANMATQYWILGRYVHAFTILISFYFINKKVSFNLMSCLYGLITIAGVLLISKGLFPIAYIDNVGQTNFKIISEYVVIAAYLASFFYISRLKAHFEGYFYQMFRIGLVLSAFAEFIFTLYVDVFSILNALGHILKMSAFYFFYRACVYATLNKPIETIFNKLDENRRFLNSIIESFTYPFYVIDASTKKIKMANSASGLINYENINCNEATHHCNMPCADDKDYCLVEHIKKTKQPKILEKISKDKEGNERAYEVHSYPIISNSGEVDQIIEYCFDVTERKIEKAQLEKLSLAIEQSSNSIVITDAGGFIEYINSSFCRITGYDKNEVLGKTPSILKSGLMPKEFYEDMWKTITGGKIWRGEVCNKTKSGELIWELLTITPLRDLKGNITHYVGILEDIRDRIRAEIAERKVSETEKKVMELERELQSLDKIISLHQPTITARSYGHIPLRESMPDLFNELLKNYTTLYHNYIEAQVYKINYDIMEQMKQYIDTLGNLKIGPRELIDIHTTSLKIMSKDMPSEKMQAYVNEGKLMLIELMGYLVNFYRNYFIITSKKSKS